jgi:MYXO-CTERM domain-containing protein
MSSEDGGGRSVSSELEDSGGCSTTRASHTELAPVLLALAAVLRRRRRSNA